LPLDAAPAGRAERARVCNHPGVKAWSFAVAFSLVALVGCTTGPPIATPSGGVVPPPPATPRQSLGADSPPVVWLGGTIDRVDVSKVRLHEDDGAVVDLQRLGAGATRFFRVSDGAWAELATQSQVDAGQRACVETLMDGTNLVAIRVFLGSGCGPR
jgi:hypothetical protein